MDVYKEKRAQLLDESELDLIHVHDFVDGFINDFDRINKRFKDPILGYPFLASISDQAKGGRYIVDGRRHICPVGPA